MKRNSLLLTLLSVIVGTIITFGLTRYDGNGHFVKGETCNDGATNTLLLVDQSRPIACVSYQRGYPFQFLHSQVSGQTASNTVSGTIWTNPWIEFRPAVADWLIWTVVSAAGIGLLVYALERCGINTGFAQKSSRKRR